MQAAVRNPQGLFEMRLTRERERIRSEATQIKRLTTRRLPIFSHIPAVLLDRFTDAVHQFDAEPVFRYSQRLSLLKLAGRLGIRRFDANLIIASIERERGLPQPQVANSRWAGAVAWSVVGLLQAMMIAGVWWTVST